jgi:hypothetical protein
MTIKANEVLEYIKPEGGWATYGDKYEDIVFVSCESISKEEFEAAAKDAEKEIKAKAKAKADAKSALLEKLGITAEEAVLLLS